MLDMFEVTTRAEVQKCDIDVRLNHRLFKLLPYRYILSLKQTEIYFVQECNFSNCLGYFLAFKIMCM